MATEILKTSEADQADVADVFHPVVLITGAGSGIGAALARRLARRGASLILHGRDLADSRRRLAAVQRECARDGVIAPLLLHAELAEATSAKRLIDAALKHFGRLDQIVACAGYARQSSISASSWSSMEEAFRVMPQSFADLLRHSLAPLAGSRCARVVAVSSFVAHRFDCAAPFIESAAAKAAIEAIAKSAAAELARQGITVNCVVPGFTRKDQPGSNPLAWQQALTSQPSGQIAEPDQVAACIEFLLQPEAAHITGTMLHVDGGLTLL
jgi:NAD(P)-dependent dehydrogenase (short-subunit alcohol dehydrogenase family)